MQSRHNKRLEELEGKAVVHQRRTLPGLVALCESGKLRVDQLTDEELERLIVGLPGDAVDMSHLSDAELEQIIGGRR